MSPEDVMAYQETVTPAALIGTDLFVRLVELLDAGWHLRKNASDDGKKQGFELYISEGLGWNSTDVVPTIEGAIVQAGYLEVARVKTRARQEAIDKLIHEASARIRRENFGDIARRLAEDLVDAYAAIHELVDAYAAIRELVDNQAGHVELGPGTMAALARSRPIS